jgi:sec-independent protein translocase protein TatC
MAEPEHPAGAEGSFLSHLLELRNRLLYAILSVALVAVPLLVFSNEVYSFVARPLLEALPKGASMVATDVASPFLTPVKLAFIAAFVIAVPFVLYQLWAFIAPGLYRRERRLVAPLIVSSTVLFYGGMAFAYFIVFPLVFAFFVATTPPGVTVMTDIKSYMDFVFSMFIAFGIAFEVPVAVVLLSHMGVVDPETLAKKRPYVVLWVFIAAAVLTPPDVFSQTFLAAPMLLLFEAGLFVARRLRPAGAADGDTKVMTDAEIEAEFARHDRRFSEKKKKRRR